MTVQHQKTTAQPSAPPSLARLRVREAALRHQAAQLQARAEHLDRVGRAHAQRLQRRIDAHEKIVLGALVKKAGLDIPQSEAHQPPNDDDSTPLRGGLAAQSTAYDRALILEEADEAANLAEIGRLAHLAGAVARAGAAMPRKTLHHIIVDGFDRDASGVRPSQEMPRRAARLRQSGRGSRDAVG